MKKVIPIVLLSMLTLSGIAQPPEHSSPKKDWRFGNTLTKPNER